MGLPSLLDGWLFSACDLEELVDCFCGNSRFPIEFFLYITGDVFPFWETDSS